ncbi:UNVERIFIED_CONTAM: hypothetical protein H355_007786 [Colinus virginianus]|nr:hypothetical protein H355_007786 [Colinus virginianus]
MVSVQMVSVQMVVYKNNDFKLELSRLAQEGHARVTLHGALQFRCEAVAAPDPVSFGTPRAFLVVPGGGAGPRSGSVSFDFRTTEPNGLLLFGRGPPPPPGSGGPPPDFVALELLDGHLYVVLRMGARTTKLRGSARKVTDGEWCHVDLQRDGRRGKGPETLFAGQRLDDNEWHSVRVVRRGRSLQLSVDNVTVEGQLSGAQTRLELQHVETGMVTERRFAAVLPSNFLGHLSSLLFNGRAYLDLCKNGDISACELNARFGRRSIVADPVSFRGRGAYAALATLQAYGAMHLFFQFRSTAPDGIILYSAGSGNDFLVVELVKGVAQGLHRGAQGLHVEEHSGAQGLHVEEHSGAQGLHKEEH